MQMHRIIIFFFLLARVNIYIARITQSDKKSFDVYQCSSLGTESLKWSVINNNNNYYEAIFLNTSIYNFPIYIRVCYLTFPQHFARLSTVISYK